MKCPKCKFISFDYLEECKRCGISLKEIKATLCPGEVAPASRSLWEWLGFGLTQQTKREEAPQQYDGFSERPMEIQLDEAEEEIIIDESAIIDEQSLNTLEEESKKEIDNVIESIVSGVEAEFDSIQDQSLPSKELNGHEMKSPPQELKGEKAQVFEKKYTEIPFEISNEEPTTSTIHEKVSLPKTAKKTEEGEETEDLDSLYQEIDMIYSEDEDKEEK